MYLLRKRKQPEYSWNGEEESWRETSCLFTRSRGTDTRMSNARRNCQELLIRPAEKSQGEHGCNYAAGVCWIPKKKPLDITSKWTWTSIYIALFWSTDCSECSTMHATFAHSHTHTYIQWWRRSHARYWPAHQEWCSAFYPKSSIIFLYSAHSHAHWWKSHREQFGGSVSLAQEHLDMRLEPGSITADLLICRQLGLPSAKSHQNTSPRNHLS